MIRISVKDVSKRFDLDSRNHNGALSKLLFSFSANQVKNQLQALNGISFEANEGEIVGIVGRNGSGKSTLLRIIAEVYMPDGGEVVTNGKVIYLTGFGQGLISRLTMRENIYLISSLLGLSQKDIRNKFDEIVNFSGLERFVDTKVYQFSSGMITRLGVSVTLHGVKHHNPDILLVDEAIATSGDIDFHTQAVAKMEELIRGGATVLLVSHNTGFVEKCAHRVIWIDHGQIKKIGEPAETIRKYVHSDKERKI
jgi:ABC-type polysaccharide/polyol phosphate transport system ATPase subunit